MTSLEEISVETVMIWNFYQVLKTGDYNYLRKGATEEDWYKLYDEYFEKAKFKTGNYKDLFKYQSLVKKYVCIQQLLEILRGYTNQVEVKKALKNWGYVYNEDEDKMANLERFYGNLSVIGTKLELLKENLPEESGEVNLWKTIVVLKKHFKMPIDPKTTTCAEFIELQNQLKEDVRSSRHTSTERGNRKR